MREKKMTFSMHVNLTFLESYNILGDYINFMNLFDWLYDYTFTNKLNILKKIKMIS